MIGSTRSPRAQADGCQSSPSPRCPNGRRREASANGRAALLRARAVGTPALVGTEGNCRFPPVPGLPAPDGSWPAVAGNGAANHAVTRSNGSVGVGERAADEPGGHPLYSAVSRRRMCVHVRDPCRTMHREPEIGGEERNRGHIERPSSRRAPARAALDSDLLHNRANAANPLASPGVIFTARPRSCGRRRLRR